jgi:hypothetical protein
MPANLQPCLLISLCGGSFPQGKLGSCPIRGACKISRGPRFGIIPNYFFAFNGRLFRDLNADPRHLDVLVGADEEVADAAENACLQ